jgi:uncharacterized protein (TIGR04551 family)
MREVWMKRHLSACALLLACWLLPALATAQFSTRPGSGMGASSGKTETPQGPAEAAPEGKEEEPELPKLPPWPGQETKKLQAFQMNGYFRFRMNMFHNLNLGLLDVGNYKAPFYLGISEQDQTNGTYNCSKRASIGVPGSGSSTRDLNTDHCPGATLVGANIRLRVEPTINVSEQVRINAQFDIFDNLVLGSTPQSLSSTASSNDVPSAFFSNGQAAPISGRNSSSPAILVKRVWADVGVLFGQIKAGRMPANWGMGMIVNDGRCENCDYGDSVDRVMLSADLVGHTFGMAYDFNSSGPTTMSVASGINQYGGQAIDIEPLDNVHELMWMAARIDKEEVIKDRVERGELVINYGLMLLWRKQDFDYDRSSSTYKIGYGASETYLSNQLIERHAWAMMPDLWFKLLFKKLSLEFEFAFIGGQIENTVGMSSYSYSTSSTQVVPLSIVQFGWTMKAHYKFLKDALTVGLEIGMASGDETEPLNTDVMRRRTSQVDAHLQNILGYGMKGDSTLKEFRFNYDYHVDLILFKEILSCVSNAVYFKPWVQYNIVDALGARFDLIYSLAHEPVGYPGNSRNLGVELDLHIFYKNVEDGFNAGVAYGVLFPLAALSRTAEIFGSTYGKDVDVAAHTFMGRLLVKF